MKRIFDEHKNPKRMLACLINKRRRRRRTAHGSHRSINLFYFSPLFLSFHFNINLIHKSNEELRKFFSFPFPACLFACLPQFRPKTFWKDEESTWRVGRRNGNLNKIKIKYHNLLLIKKNWFSVFVDQIGKKLSSK